MKRILITNAFGPQNRGDHELLQNLVDIMKVRYGENVFIKVFTTYPSDSEKVIGGVSFYRAPFYRPRSYSEMFFLVWDLLFWNLSLLSSFFLLFLTKERRARFRDIVNADLVVMCPGGYIYSNGLSYYVNLINCMPFCRAKGYKVMSPMSIGPFFSKFDSWLCKLLLSVMDKTHVRESYSFDLVKSMGYEPIFTHDLAWWKNSSDCSEPSDNAWNGYFVGTVIDWNYPEANDDVDYRERYISEYLKAVDVLFEESGNPIILFNQVGNGDGSSKDEILIKSIVERSNGKVLFDSSACTPEVLKRKLSSCRGIIASRFHSCLFAIQVNTPFVSIAYQPKAEYILKDLNLSEFSRNICDFDGREMAMKLISSSVCRESFVCEVMKAKVLTKNNIDNTFLND